MKKQIKILAMLVMVAALVVPYGCKEDDPTPLELSTITAGTADLNGATSPTGVATDASIEIKFSTDVDASTATAANIKLMRDYDDVDIPLTITPSGSTVTVKPTLALNAGALFILTVTEGLKSDKGLALTSLTRNFTTAGFFAPSGQAAYWPMNDNGNDVVGTFTVTPSLTKDITFEAGRNAAAGKAAKFNGTTSIMEAPGADAFINAKDFSISFWVKADGTNNKGKFVLGLGAWKGFQFEIADDWSWVKLASQYNLGTKDPVTGLDNLDSEDNFWDGQGLKVDSWPGWTFNKNVVSSGGVGATYFKDKWAHVICTYNSATRLATMYVNGEKVKQHDFNKFPAGGTKLGVTGVAYAGKPAPGNTLAFGFIQGSQNRVILDGWADPADVNNNHFKGLLDDVRIFKKALTETEITLIYNSEK